MKQVQELLLSSSPSHRFGVCWHSVETFSHPFIIQIPQNSKRESARPRAMQKISCSPTVPRQDLHRECYRHPRATAAAPSSIPVPAALMPKSDLPVASVEAVAVQKTHSYILISQCFINAVLQVYEHLALFYTRKLNAAPERAARCAVFTAAASSLVTGQVKRKPPGEPGPLSQLPRTHAPLGTALQRS